MRKLDELAIDQPRVAVFASGPSLEQMTPEEFLRIKRHAFTVTMNYAPVRFDSDLNIWSDTRVSKFLAGFYEQHEKKCLFLARVNRVVAKLKDEIDFWFDPKHEGLQGNYTLVWLLQLLRKYFPEKVILLFGVDMACPDVGDPKWYDRHTDEDRRARGAVDVQSKLSECATQLTTLIPPAKIYNCNSESELDHFEKVGWRKLVGAGPENPHLTDSRFA